MTSISSNSIDSNDYYNEACKKIMREKNRCQAIQNDYVNKILNSSSSSSSISSLKKGIKRRFHEIGSVRNERVVENTNSRMARKELNNAVDFMSTLANTPQSNISNLIGLFLNCTIENISNEKNEQKE